MIYNIHSNINIDTTDLINNINIKIHILSTPEEPLKQYGFNNTLNIYRNKIDKINSDIWKKIRWYINNYDFLITEHIINRAFYKYWEIIHEFNIFDNYTPTDLIFHCAEAPGGFIQGTNIFLQLNKNTSKPIENKTIDGFTIVSKKKSKPIPYKIYTISLNKDLPKYKHYNLPSYNKNVINKHVNITYGKDNTGNINNLDNINYIKYTFNKQYYLLTADGGFDEGNDFNHKEQLHYFLILNEIYSAIKLQQLNGHFILKVFDIYTETSIQLLYLLHLIYSEVYIYKPKTSRPTNSEKYIICKNFKLKDDNTRQLLLNKLYTLSQTLDTNQKYKYNSFSLFQNIPIQFQNNIKYINTNLLNNQCKYLETAISLCDNQQFINNYDSELKYNFDKRNHIFKQWSKEYKLDTFVQFN